MHNVLQLSSLSKPVPFKEKSFSKNSSRVKDFFLSVFSLRELSNFHLSEKMIGNVRKRFQKIEGEKRYRVARDQLLIIGSAKKENSTNSSDTDLIVRTVMRHPGEKALEKLYELHGLIKETLGNLSNDVLEWIIGGIGYGLRGRFQRVEDLKSFLEIDPKTIRTSCLILRLNSLLTAIAYRHIRHPNCLSPVEPESEAQSDFDNLLAEISKYRVDDHSERYPDSRSSLLQSIPYDEYCALSEGGFDFCDKSWVATPFREALSDASDLEDEEKNKCRTASNIFQRKEGDRFTWMGLGEEEKIPLRAGISGTTLIVLSTIAWLYRKNRETEFRESIGILSTILMIPVLHRGDFHSVAETMTAIHHYINESSLNPDRKKVLSPRQALELGLELIIQVMDLQYQKAARVLKSAILIDTKSIGYNPLIKTVFLNKFSIGSSVEDQYPIIFPL